MKLTPAQVDETRAQARDLSRLAVRLLEGGDIDGALLCTDTALKLDGLAREAINAWAA